MNALAGEDGWIATKQRDCLHLIFSSSSFWKGTLPPYRENQNESEPSESPSSFHSFEDDADDEVEVAATGSEMVISTSLGNLKIK